jgi:hypothetical protein
MVTGSPEIDTATNGTCRHRLEINVVSHVPKTELAMVGLRCDIRGDFVDLSL